MTNCDRGSPYLYLKGPRTDWIAFLLRFVVNRQTDFAQFQSLQELIQVIILMHVYLNILEKLDLGRKVRSF